MLRSIKDWLMVGLLLLDEVAALVLVLLVLWFFKIRISFEIVIVIALLLGTFVFITHKVIIPSFHKRQVTGSEGMVGLVGEVIEPLAPVGVVRVEGELWKAKAVDEDDISAGEDVEILRLQKLTLEVKRKDR